MIQLTAATGQLVWINPNHVTSVEEEGWDLEHDRPCVAVMMSHGNGWRVRGISEAIAMKVSEAQMNRRQQYFIP